MPRPASVVILRSCFPISFIFSRTTAVYSDRDEGGSSPVSSLPGNNRFLLFLIPNFAVLETSASVANERQNDQEQAFSFGLQYTIKNSSFVTYVVKKFLLQFRPISRGVPFSCCDPPLVCRIGCLLTLESALYCALYRSNCSQPRHAMSPTVELPTCAIEMFVALSPIIQSVIVYLGKIDMYDCVSIMVWRLFLEGSCTRNL